MAISDRIKRKPKESPVIPDFGAAGAPIDRGHPFYFGFVATIGALSAFVLMRALASASQVFVLILVALFLATGLNPAVEAIRQDRLENLEELVNAAATFAEDPEATRNIDAETGEATSLLADFLAHAALEAGEHQAGDSDDAIQLMTVHSAKGLEFTAVFIVGLEQGLFPHENAMLERDGLEEERRLMYVAITRARQRLYLCHAQTRMLHGQTRYCLPSGFLDELPDALLQRLDATPSWAGSYTTSSWTPAPAVDMTTRVAARAAGDTGGSGFRVGQSVVHAKFGAGVILASEGRGDEARVQVRFSQAGTKWLALAFAKLEAV